MNGRWMLYIMLLISVALLAYGLSVLGDESTGEVGTIFASSINPFWFLFIGFLIFIASVGFLIAEIYRKKNK